IESLEFLRQSRQCGNCFMFGHYRSSCKEKTKSVRLEELSPHLASMQRILWKVKPVYHSDPS
ncbi:Hypothetical protein FKW44_009551, partial [Caligus rogercresseyi]